MMRATSLLPYPEYAIPRLFRATMNTSEVSRTQRHTILAGRNHNCNPTFEPTIRLVVNGFAAVSMLLGCDECSNWAKAMGHNDNRGCR